jgi:hypothetical protein
MPELPPFGEDRMTTTKTTHVIELVHPFYGSKGHHTAICNGCGWTSEECETAGRATSAGWQHIHSTRQELPATGTREAKETL